jgi:hypothetical protein
MSNVSGRNSKIQIIRGSQNLMKTVLYHNNKNPNEK